MHPNLTHIGTFTGSGLRAERRLSKYERSRRAQHIAQGFIAGWFVAVLVYGLATTEAALKLAAV